SSDVCSSDLYARNNVDSCCSPDKTRPDKKKNNRTRKLHSKFDYRQVMEQEPTPIIEILVLILFLGSITFLLGAIFQGYVLYKNKKSLLTSISVIILTRILTIISSYFIWAFWHLPIDIMFLFFYLPAILSELIFSPLILKIFGNEIIKKKAVA